MADIIPDIQPGTGGSGGDASWSQYSAVSNVNFNGHSIQNASSVSASGGITANTVNATSVVASSATALNLNSNVIDSPVGYLTVSKPLLMPSTVSFQQSGGVTWGLMQPTATEPGLKVGKQVGTAVQYGYLYDSSINPPPAATIPSDVVRNPMLSSLAGGGYDITGGRAIKPTRVTPLGHLTNFIRIQIPDATGLSNWVNLSEAVGGAYIPLNTVVDGCKLSDCGALMLYMTFTNSTAAAMGYSPIAVSFGFGVDTASYGDARIVGTTYVPNGFTNSNTGVYLLRNGYDYNVDSQSLGFWINFLSGSSFTNAGLSAFIAPAL